MKLGEILNSWTILVADELPVSVSSQFFLWMKLLLLLFMG